MRLKCGSGGSFGMSKTTFPKEVVSRLISAGVNVKEIKDVSEYSVTIITDKGNEYVIIRAGKGLFRVYNIHSGYARFSLLISVGKYIKQMEEKW